MNNTIMCKEIHQQPEVILDCIQKNDALLKSISDDIKNLDIKNIIIAARGSSDHIAIFAKYLFEIYCGKPVSLSAPSVFTTYDSNLDFTSSIVIALSQSGAAEDVNEVVKRANECGALTIGITNNEESLIAKETKYHIDCYAGEEKSVAATKTLISQMTIMTMLVAKISGNIVLNKIVPLISESAMYALSLEEAVKGIAQRYRFMDDCFVLSRGVSFPIAKEAALKIQETSYIKAQSYPTSDFMHGPIAMIEENTPCIVIGSDSKIENEILTIVKSLTEKNADVFAITNSNEIAKEASASILLPPWCEGILGAFCSVVILQMLAGYISVGRNNNPDNPRGLKKVTVTK